MNPREVASRISRANISRLTFCKGDLRLSSVCQCLVHGVQHCLCIILLTAEDNIADEIPLTVYDHRCWRGLHIVADRLEVTITGKQRRASITGLLQNVSNLLYLAIAQETHRCEGHIVWQ